MNQSSCFEFQHATSSEMNIEHGTQHELQLDQV